MAPRVLRKIARNIQNAVIYTIMSDETADVSNKEQLVFCLRSVDDVLIVHEDFIDMHPMKGTGADQIVFLIKDIFLRMNLRLQDAHGQCYDGAGVATQIKAMPLYPLLRTCFKSCCWSFDQISCVYERSPWYRALDL